MYIFLCILILIACVFLIGAVLIQKSKGGGLASDYSSGNQYMGYRKTTDFIEKTTWTLAIAICVLSIASAFSGRAPITSSIRPSTPAQTTAPAAAPAPAAKQPAAAPAAKPAAKPAAAPAAKPAALPSAVPATKPAAKPAAAPAPAAKPNN